MGNDNSISVPLRIPKLWMKTHVRIRILFLNANTDRRLNGVEGKAHPHYLPSNRIPKITMQVRLLLNEATIFCLCELEEDVCNQFAAEFADCATKIVAYNTSKGAFHLLLIAHNPVTLANVKAYPLTKSGESYPDAKRPTALKPNEVPTAEYKEEVALYKKEILGDNFDKMVVGVSLTVNGETIDVYFTHMGLSTEARMAQTAKLVEIIKSRLPNKFVIIGDLNAFDPSVKVPALYKPQIELIREGLSCAWLTEGVESTFEAYYFDIVFKLTEEERKKYFQLKDENKIEEFRVFCLEMVAKYGTKGGPLDHAFASKELNAIATVHPTEGLSDHAMIEVVFGN